MIDRRRFLFLGAGILATGALVPRSPLEELEAFLDVGREHFGPSFVLSFRDELSPKLERLSREMKRLGEQLSHGFSSGAFILPPMCRCAFAFQETTTAADRAAGALARMGLGLSPGPLARVCEELGLRPSEAFGELVIRKPVAL